MNTPELFDFSFVDRDREQKIFNNFILDLSKSVLWVDGKRGVGKTQFVKHTIKQHTNYSFAYYDIKPNKENIEIFTNFIETLQEIGNYDFCDFVSKEYSAFYNNLGPTVKNISKELKGNISGIISIILDITNYVLTKKKERRENTDIIQKYIEKILLKKNLFICVDNFSRCSADVIECFCNIFKPFLERSNFRICIVTTTDDMDDEKKLKIRELIPNKPITIEKFDDYRYFYEIMDPIFNMGRFTQDDIKYIYYKCNGEPQKLSVVISKLLDKQGIQYDRGRSKAYIDKQILKDILKEEYINYNSNDFSEVQKWILFSFLCLYEGAKVQDVKDLALYVAQKLHISQVYSEAVFYEELLKLVGHKHLCMDGETLGTHHDSDYIDFTDIFITSGVYPIISQSAYEFLVASSTLQDREDLICKHMREAKIQDWENRNYRYGEKLFQKHQYYDAQKVFAFLLTDPSLLNNQQLLLIGMNEYEAGHYGSAIEVMERINIDDLIDFNDKYNLAVHLGKSIYNYKGNLPQAIDKLRESLKYISPQSKEYVKVKNLLQMYYMEVPKHEGEALKIFNEIRCEYKELYPDVWASTMRGCHNFLHDEKEALELLNEAFSCTSDEIEHAYINTTKGFVYVRAGNIDAAITYFEDAYKNIKKMKRHESSYAANNCAACYMMKDNYVKAKEFLQEALFWNKTNYGKIVLYVHLMICEIFFKNNSEAERYLNFLDDYMQTAKPKDRVMLRKVYLNLAVASKELGNIIMFDKYMDIAQEYIKETSSEYRFSVIQQKNDMQPPKNIYYSYSKFDPWFLVYAHD